MAALPASAQTERAEPDRTETQSAGGQPERDEPEAPTAPQFDEEVVVVGSRARPRSVTESTVPIDVVPAADVVRQGGSNLADQLRVLLPSFHVNPQEDGDLAAVVRPASLRGLAPDHTLVLVSGKRRHRGAVIAWQGNGVADGAQGPDISTIPAIALRQIEVLRDGAAALIAVGNRHVGDPAQRWGSPQVDDDLKLFANLGHLFANGVQAYGHAGYARRDVLTFYYFRNPNTRGGVFSNDGGRTLLVGDVLSARGEGSAHCPTVAVTGDVPDPVALRAVFDDSHCFSFQERFPGGFAPRFGGVARDASLVGGLRGQLTGGVLWDASVTAGASTQVDAGGLVMMGIGPGSQLQRARSASHRATRSSAAGMAAIIRVGAGTLPRPVACLTSSEARWPLTADTMTDVADVDDGRRRWSNVKHRGRPETEPRGPLEERRRARVARPTERAPLSREAGTGIA